MSEEESTKLREKIKELDNDLKREMKARIDAEEEARQAKEAQEAAEKSKSEMQKTIKAIQGQVSGTYGNDSPTPLMKRVHPYVYYFLIGGLILYILYWVFSKGVVLQELRNVAYARGLITFIFSLGTMGIGVILTIAALEKGEDAGASFTRGKEIFTILVGILGTIVGFYFGSSEATTQATPLKVAAVQISNPSPNENTQITLSTDIKGAAPYIITLEFQPDLIEPIIQTIDTEGKFEKELTLPEVDKDEAMIIFLTVTDRAGNQVKNNSPAIMIKNTD
jgi:hypothetical protein